MYLYKEYRFFLLILGIIAIVWYFLLFFFILSQTVAVAIFSQYRCARYFHSATNVLYHDLGFYILLLIDIIDGDRSR
jgi:hypothetical protein